MFKVVILFPCLLFFLVVRLNHCCLLALQFPLLEKLFGFLRGQCFGVRFDRFKLILRHRFCGRCWRLRTLTFPRPTLSCETLANHRVHFFLSERLDRRCFYGFRCWRRCLFRRGWFRYYFSVFHDYSGECLVDRTSTV